MKIWVLLILLIVEVGAEELADGGGKNLFILSGQSNMAGMDPAISFTPAVSKAFGKENIIVAKSAYSGASIRSWAKSNHEDPPPTRGRVPKVRGHFYDTLIEKVKTAIKGQGLETVTLVWMQGESDLNNTAYEAQPHHAASLVCQPYSTCPHAWQASRASPPLPGRVPRQADR